jgi:hypothetical protein
MRYFQTGGGFIDTFDWDIKSSAKYTATYQWFEPPKPPKLEKAYMFFLNSTPGDALIALSSAISIHCATSVPLRTNTGYVNVYELYAYSPEINFMCNRINSLNPDSIFACKNKDAFDAKLMEYEKSSN